jgi:hypothetical protein
LTLTKKERSQKRKDERDVQNRERERFRSVNDEGGNYVISDARKIKEGKSRALFQRLFIINIYIIIIIIINEHVEVRSATNLKRHDSVVCGLEYAGEPLWCGMVCSNGVRSRHLRTVGSW